MGDRPTEPERVVQRQVDFYNARDIEGFLSAYARDAIVGRFPDGKVVAKGHDEMRKAYAPLFQSNPLLNCRIVQRIVTGNIVIDQEHITGRPGKDALLATAIYAVEGGVIQRVWLI